MRALARVPRAGGIVLALAWCALIWVLSSRSRPPPEHPSRIGSLLSNFYHAPAFGALALWLALALPRRAGWPELTRARTIAIMIAVLAYALIDEAHQSFVPRRDASLLDVLTDLVGALCMLRGLQLLSDAELSQARIARFLVLGLLACIAAALIASFLPALFPEHPGRFGI
jgi:VanZ family protein